MRSVQSTAVVLGLIFCWSSNAQEEDKYELLEILNQYSSLSASFVQRLVDKEGEEVSVQSGYMRARSPNLFWWEIQDPYTMIYRLESPNVLIFDEDLNQVSYHQLDTELELPIVALLLQEDAEVLDDYQVVRRRNSFELTPNRNSLPFTSIRVYFAGNALDAIDVLDGMGQRTEFNFSNLQVNIDLEDSKFSLDLPEGVEVIGEKPLEVVEE